MQKYNASFIGRVKGAIGIMYRHDVVVQGKNPEDASMRVYDTHEHIMPLCLSPIVKASEVEPGSVIQLFDQVGKRTSVCTIIGHDYIDSCILGKNLAGETVYLANDAECYVIKG